MEEVKQEEKPEMPADSAEPVVERVEGFARTDEPVREGQLELEVDVAAKTL